MLGLHAGLRPFNSASRSCAPVTVTSAARLLNGSTANTSPQVISPDASGPVGANGRSARRPPEFVSASTASGYFASIASATRFPTSDSLSRAGSRRMSAVSTAAEPTTRLRSGAVSVFAASTIACTSGRPATPRFLAIRTAVPAHATSPPLIMSWATE